MPATMPEEATDKTVEVKPRYSKKKIARNATLFILATTVAYLHYEYSGILYENATHFSHLSDLEKEIALRTEQGFYYSYYKTIIEEPMFIDGIFKIMYDRLVEYPDYVNAFNRFNIHPEVIIGAIYRYFEPVLNTTARRDCALVYRGAGAAPVRACAGRGHPAAFYLTCVWALHALLPAAVLLHAATLSESILGGVLSIAQYLANHGEATRAQWSPGLRENLAAPLLFLQMWLLSLQLRQSDRKTCFRLQVSIFILNCLCLLFWQFSQFIFLTQIVIFFMMEQLKIIDLKTFCVFLHSHFCGLHMAVLLLQGNEMLKCSLYSSTFIVISTYALFFSGLRIKVLNRFDLFVESWLVFLRIAIVGCASIYLKKVISDFLNVSDDDHIWELLYAKFTNYKSFHTLIYTCADVFDFLPLTTIFIISKTLLLPFVIISTILASVYWTKNAILEVQRMKTDAEMKDSETNQVETEKQDDTDDSGIENNAETTLVRRKKRLDLDKLEKDGKSEEKEVIVLDDAFIAFLKVLNIDPAIFYNIAQMVVFGILAVLFMRLKMLFVTQMCIVGPLIVNTKYEIKTPSWSTRLVFWTISLSLLLYQLFVNMSQELSVISEVNAFRTEELLEWIMRETHPGAVFAGSMPTLAAVLLSTRRAVVLHPHYEHSRTRDRVYAVYKAYGRFSAEELYQELTKLQVTYLIIEVGLCYKSKRSGAQDCTLSALWDAAMPSHRHRPSLCHSLLTEQTEHLYPVYNNQWYSVFRVHDLSVRYMPRVFDT